MPTFRLAAVQTAPVFMDREATVTKACELITEAARGGARLVVFPEAFIPTYPDWVWHIPPGEHRMNWANPGAIASYLARNRSSLTYISPKPRWIS